MNTVNFDQDLNPVLEKADSQALAPLDALITSKVSETLSLEDAYRRHNPDHSMYADLLAAHFRRYGGNTFANAVRDHGPAYHDIACEVAKAVKAPFNRKRPIKDIEASILATVCETAWQEMSEDERREMLQKVGKPNLTFLKGGSAMVVQAFLRSAGFAPYELTVVIANKVVTQAIGRGLPFAANWMATKGLSVAIGPVGWVASTLVTLNQFAGPAHRVIIPGVIYVASLRLMQSHVQCSNCDATVPDSFAFCPECGTEVSKS